MYEIVNTTKTSQIIPPKMIKDVEIFENTNVIIIVTNWIKNKSTIPPMVFVVNIVFLDKGIEQTKSALLFLYTKSNNDMLLNKINEIIEPKSENALSRAYDWLMLIAIVLGILPLMFRKQYQIFFVGFK